MVHKMEVGPEPVPFKSLTVARLVSALENTFEPSVIYSARALGP